MSADIAQISSRCVLEQTTVRTQNQILSQRVDAFVSERKTALSSLKEHAQELSAAMNRLTTTEQQAAAHQLTLNASKAVLQTVSSNVEGIDRSFSAATKKFADLTDLASSLQTDVRRRNQILNTLSEITKKEEHILDILRGKYNSMIAIKRAHFIDCLCVHGDEVRKVATSAVRMCQVATLNVSKQAEDAVEKVACVSALRDEKSAARDQVVSQLHIKEQSVSGLNEVTLPALRTSLRRVVLYVAQCEDDTDVAWSAARRKIAAAESVLAAVDSSLSVCHERKVCVEASFRASNSLLAHLRSLSERLPVETNAMYAEHADATSSKLASLREEYYLQLSRQKKAAELMKDMLSARQELQEKHVAAISAHTTAKKSAVSRAVNNAAEKMLDNSNAFRTALFASAVSISVRIAVTDHVFRYCVSLSSLCAEYRSIFDKLTVEEASERQAAEERCGMRTRREAERIALLSKEEDIERQSIQLDERAASGVFQAEFMAIERMKRRMRTSSSAPSMKRSRISQVSRSSSGWGLFASTPQQLQQHSLDKVIPATPADVQVHSGHFVPPPGLPRPKFTVGGTRSGNTTVVAKHSVRNPNTSLFDSDW
eukprot:TRINITY_DN67538_c0_g1_i1.p1 TRINITY_DN67538_c0_g1~~TRINITY_DN67538_c0_g1_i1.p1  ORF type:complete len:599 (+),score=51.56 TRINITY_DN67538_c0_g1_i1:108-1904(+)